MSDRYRVEHPIKNRGRIIQRGTIVEMDPKEAEKYPWALSPLGSDADVEQVETTEGPALEVDPDAWLESARLVNLAHEHGLEPDAVVAMTNDDLTALDGVGTSTAVKLRESAQEYLEIEGESTVVTEVGEGGD